MLEYKQDFVKYTSLYIKEIFLELDVLLTV